VGWDGETHKDVSTDHGSEIFLQMGLDTPVNKPPDGQITTRQREQIPLVSRTRCSALSRCSAEPGPLSTLRDGPRLGSAPLRAAEPGNAVAPPEVYQTCLMKECGESKFRSRPGRGAAFFTLLRRAGTYLDTSSMQPAQ
jgi:hypothetical protein